MLLHYVSFIDVSSDVSKKNYSYLARPLEECRMASYEERSAAYKAAEEIQENLESEIPSFVKSMVRSHVYSCFWLVSCNEIVFLAY